MQAREDFADESPPEEASALASEAKADAETASQSSDSSTAAPSTPDKQGTPRPFPVQDPASPQRKHSLDLPQGKLLCAFMLLLRPQRQPCRCSDSSTAAPSAPDKQGTPRPRPFPVQDPAPPQRKHSLDLPQGKLLSRLVHVHLHAGAADVDTAS